jgi:hypothetical protein
VPIRFGIFVSAGCILVLLFAVQPLFAKGTLEPAVVAAIISPTAKKAGSSTTKRINSTRKPSGKIAVRKPGRRHLTFTEVENRNIYKVIEKYLYRMCIKEIPFFLALHEGYYRDKRLDRGDTLVLKKKVLSALLVNASHRLSTSELTISPVTNIDSMMVYRSKVKNGRTTQCGMIIYTTPGVYDIPKTGAKVSVPRIVKGIISRNGKTGSMFVRIQTKGVKLHLPGYAKVVSLGMISDMDVRYAELVPSGPGFEARLMYVSKEKKTRLRGWSLNVTECNKIRPYAR